MDTGKKRPFLHFNDIKVNAIETNSGIFVGTNTQTNWKSNNHTKSGFGSVIGHYNSVHRNLNIFKDDDLVDTPIFSPSHQDKV